MTEKYWLDETDPAQLHRRAGDQDREGHLALAQQLRERADEMAESTAQAEMLDEIRAMLRHLTGIENESVGIIAKEGSQDV